MKSKSSSLARLQKYLPLILLLLIIALAIFFRFWELWKLPPGLHPDEAANGLDIFRMFNHHDFRIIYNTNGPREALFFYLQAIWVGLLGNTIAALRVAPASIGVAAVVMVYFLAKDWFGRRTALIAAFLMAVNPWAVIISRDGFRAGMTPLMVAAVAFLAGRAYKTQRYLYFVLAGAIFGLGFYTYTAFALFSLVPAAGLLYMLLWRRSWLKANLAKLAVSALVALVVLTPLAITVIRHPSDSTARAGGTSVLNRDLNGGRPIQTLLSGVGKTFLQYNLFGDENPRHNLPGQPLVNAFVGIMLILGLVVALTRLKRLNYSATIAMFFVMMLPAILTAEGLPHALRSVGTEVGVFLLAAIGVNYLLQRWYRTFPVNGPARNIGLALVCALLFLTAFQGYRAYFVAWAQSPDTYAAYAENMTVIGNYLNAHGTGTQNYLVAGEYNAKPVEYLTHNKAKYNLLSDNQLRDLPLNTGTGTKLFVVPAGDQANAELELLKTKFPGGASHPQYSGFSGKTLFYVYEVSPSGN